MNKKTNVYKLTLTALMSALICILSPLAFYIPISQTPISLGTFAVYLAALVLGYKLGTTSVLVYLLLGFAGVPVFTGFTGGFAKLAGPTGGYLIGYLAITVIAGWFADKFEKKIVMYYIGLVLGTAALYLFGTAWMAFSLHMTPGEALAAGVLPFLPLDAVKIIAAGLLAYPLRKQLMRMFPALTAVKSKQPRTN